MKKSEKDCSIAPTVAISESDDVDSKLSELLKLVKIDVERDFKRSGDYEQSIGLISLLQKRLTKNDWGSTKDCRLLVSLSQAFLHYLDSKDDLLIKTTFNFLIFLVQKLNKKLTGLFERILNSMIIKTILFNDKNIDQAQHLHLFLCQLFIYNPEEVLSLFIFKINNEQNNSMEHRFIAVCYFKLLLWRFPKKTLNKYFENLRNLVDILLRDESIIIQEHSYFALSIMDRRFPLLTKKIFKFMSAEYEDRYLKITEVTSDQLYLNMEKIIHNTGRYDNNELQKLNPFFIVELKEYFENILESELVNKTNKNQDKHILPRIKIQKKYRPLKILSYVDELAEEQDNDNGESKQQYPKPANELNLSNGMQQQSERKLQPESEQERWRRVIEQKLTKLKLKCYDQIEPTIDECTEESKDTSIDQRITDRSQKSLKNINFEFKLRFGRKFRPKSLDPSKELPGIYSTTTTPKANKSKDFVVYDSGNYHNPFIGINAAHGSDQNIHVMSPLNINTEIASAREVRSQHFERYSKPVDRQLSKLFLRNKTISHNLDVFKNRGSAHNSTFDMENDMVNLSIDKKLERISFDDIEFRNQRERLVKEKQLTIKVQKNQKNRDLFSKLSKNILEAKERYFVKKDISTRITSEKAKTYEEPIVLRKLPVQNTESFKNLTEQRNSILSKIKQVTTEPQNFEGLKTIKHQNIECPSQSKKMQEFMNLLSDLDSKIAKNEKIDAKQYVEQKEFHLFYSLEDLMGTILKWFKEGIHKEILMGIGLIDQTIRLFDADLILGVLIALGRDVTSTKKFVDEYLRILEVIVKRVELHKVDKHIKKSLVIILDKITDPKVNKILLYLQNPLTFGTTDHKIYQQADKNIAPRTELNTHVMTAKQSTMASGLSEVNTLKNQPYLGNLIANND